MIDIYPGLFVCFEGPLRAGKTLNMTRVGAMAALQGKKIYANYEVSYAQKLESIEDMLNATDGVLLLDEMQSIFDSRDFKNTTDLTQWMLLVGKRKLSVFYTTQWIGQVDIRARNITNYLYRCRRCFFKGGLATKCEVYEVYADQGRLINKFILPHTPALYALYDTYDTRVKLVKGGRITSFDPDGKLSTPAFVPVPSPTDGEATHHEVSRRSVVSSLSRRSFS